MAKYITIAAGIISTICGSIIQYQHWVLDEPISVVLWLVALAAMLVMLLAIRVWVRTENNE